MGKENVKNDEVRKNLSLVIQDLKLNNNSFASMVEIDASNFSKKMKGEQNITSKDLSKLSRANINPDFLLTGKGDMYLGPVKSEKKFPESKAIPIYKETWGGGFLTFEDSSVTPVGYLYMPEIKGATCWCRLTGESMRPEINSGDYICLKRIVDWDEFIVFGEIYAIDTVNDMRTVKYVERGDTDDEFKLVPANKEMKPQMIKKSVIRNMFRVINVMKAL